MTGFTLCIGPENLKCLAVSFSLKKLLAVDCLMRSYERPVAQTQLLILQSSSAGLSKLFPSLAAAASLYCFPFPFLLGALPW